VSVTPVPGSVDVDTNTDITIEFDQSMQGNIYAALYGADMSGLFGSVVSGTWSWSQDSTQLTFTPDSSLNPGTRYTIRVGGGMMDLDSNFVDFEQYGQDMGGQWMTAEMMQQCITNGFMMGQEWQHQNGSYGMIFTFTTAGTTVGATSLVSVTPVPGSVDVDTNTAVTIEFDQSMQGNIYAALYGADMSGLFGSVVSGTWSWSQDSTQLTFTPDSPLNPGTRYTIRVGGGMMDLDSNFVDFEQYGQDMGGQWMTSEMMQQCMMNGFMMGQEWQHQNGSYGLIFTFTTL
jgi:methionine-rich copper-binding protein CopC